MKKRSKTKSFLAQPARPRGGAAVDVVAMADAPEIDVPVVRRARGTIGAGATARVIRADGSWSYARVIATALDSMWGCPVASVDYYGCVVRFAWDRRRGLWISAGSDAWTLHTHEED